MVVVDANVLLYAVNSSLPQHRAARSWIEPALSGDEPVGFSWAALLAFVRITTLAPFSPQPLTTDEAFELVHAWLAAPAATVVAPTSRHASILHGLLRESGTAGNLVLDAHLAALAVEHHARVCTFDRDFARFKGVPSFAPV